MELHLVVLWEYARTEERRILDDIAQRLELVHTEILSWPSDPISCFRRFYGVNLPSAEGKVSVCGGGSFRMIVVRDPSPRYDWRETSRGHERVNVNLFELKDKYRAWTGGGHRVHTTNSVAETAHDILMLTGFPLSAWEQGCPSGRLTVLPGTGGWRDLRSFFSFLAQLTPYVVLRNHELLPDRFDPSMHGDIDLLVPDAETCANALGARKVFPEPYRVHYEVEIGGRPVRLDLRFVGDDYYDRRWESQMLERRQMKDGVWLLAPEDAFYALVYHALYQKPQIAGDYPAKALDLARQAQVKGASFDDWILELEAFLERNGYDCPIPQDKSVFRNELTVNWRPLAEEIARCSGAHDVRPFNLAGLEHYPTTFFFSAEFGGEKCFVKWFFDSEAVVAEWRYPMALAADGGGGRVPAPRFWHFCRCRGGAFVISSMLSGVPLSVLIDRNDRLLVERGDVIVSDLLDIAGRLDRAHIVHRDIRPDNLMVDSSGRVTLIDFQYVAPVGNVPETAFLRENPHVLYVLGGADGVFRFGPGQWNDCYSVRQVIRLLPESTARTAALKELAPLSERPVKVASCSREKMNWIRRRIALLRRRKFVAHFSGRRKAVFDARYAEELEFLSYIARNWHVI